MSGDRAWTSPRPCATAAPITRSLTCGNKDGLPATRHSARMIGRASRSERRKNPSRSGGPAQGFVDQWRFTAPLASIARGRCDRSPIPTCRKRSRSQVHRRQNKSRARRDVGRQRRPGNPGQERHVQEVNPIGESPQRTIDARRSNGSAGHVPNNGRPPDAQAQVDDGRVMRHVLVADQCRPCERRPRSEPCSKSRSQ